MIWSRTSGFPVPNEIRNFVTDLQQFDLKFTKGNTVIVPTKLGYLQRRYAEKYAEEGGSMFENMVQRVLANVKDASMNTNR